MTKIKFYDWLELKTVIIPIQEAKQFYQSNKNDYDDLDSFMEIHFISKKHKKQLQENEGK